MHDLLLEWTKVWFEWVQNWGYLGVIILMAMESSIFPVPSEVVIPPAAILAYQGHMTFWGVVAAGTFGSYLGSSITYAVSYWVGRPIILKWGKYFFISPEKLERAERFLARYEAGGIFFARLLPVVRHLISIPVGLIRMKFGMFSLMTTVGSFLWCLILTWYGYGIAKRNPELMNDPAQLVNTIKHESVWLVVGIAALGILYFVMLRLTNKKPSEAKQ